jgi:hypothetical protein
MNAMSSTNRRFPAALLLLGAAFSLGGLLSPSPAAEKRVADKDVATWVERRVQDWQPTAAERRFDEIGWVKDIREALRLAKEHNRPVFLFTHDGRIGIGRC